MASYSGFGGTAGPSYDEDYDEDANAMEEQGALAYPFFQSTDPALRSAYSFGDPRGGTYPEPPTPQIHSTIPTMVDPELVYENIGAAVDADEGDEDAIRNAAILDEAMLDANNPRRDPDYHSSDQESVGSQGESSSSDIPGDGFDIPQRGRGRGRSRPRGSRSAGRARGTRGRPQSRGRGGRGRDNPPARVIKRTRKPVDLGVEFKALNAKMTAAWIAQDYDTALHWGLEAVKVNPDVFELHGTIAEILIRQGRKEDAIGALITGVHASKKVDNWWYVVNRLEELGGSSLTDVRGQLMYCYTAIIRLNGDDFQARKLRMRGYMEQGLLVRAKNEARRCLQMEPGDVEAMKHLAEISASLDEPEQATPYFKRFIESCMQRGHPEDTQLTWETVNWYIDTLLEAKDYKAALRELTTISRWLLGRSHETYWDGFDDDREWDIDDEPRREEVPEFHNGMLITERYGEGLPIELQVKLGVARLGLGDQYLTEALHHFQHLESQDGSTVVDYADLFHEAGDALRVAGHYEQALRFYEPLKDIEMEPMDVEFFFDLAITYHALGRKREMQECIDKVQQTANGRDPKYQLGLAKIYKALGRDDLTWKLIVVLRRAGNRSMIRKSGLPLAKPISIRATIEEELEEDEEEEEARQAEDAASPDTPQLPDISYKTIEPTDKDLPARSKKSTTRGPYKPRKSYKVTEKEEALKDSVAESIYAELQSLSSAVEAEDPIATQQWLQLCSELFEDFRHQSAFFNPEKYIPFAGFKRSRQVRIPDAKSFLDNPSVEFEVPNDYRTINFNEWVDVLMAYAVQLAEQGDSKQCWAVIEVAEDANVILQSEDRIRLVKVTGIACALILVEERRLCERTRWFIKTYPYQTDVYRLHSVLHRACKGPLMWYNAGPEQKFLLRQIKAMDFALLPEAKKKEVIENQEFDRQTISGRSEGNPHNVTEHDPALLALYGHIMLVAGSVSNALAYYFRAFAIVPEDPVICLCIAVSYIGIAFKRQTIERQYLIQQALTFAQKYYQIRTKGDVAALVQEAEFNMALIWQKMGLLHLATEGYEKVLALSERVQREGREGVSRGELLEDFAVDAAFALQNVLGMGGDVEGARRITERWLVFE